MGAFMPKADGDGASAREEECAMAKSALNEVRRESGSGTPASTSRNKRAGQVFDERGRTIPWMARTLHRLYNGHAQKILQGEGHTSALCLFLRIRCTRRNLTHW